MKDHRHFTRFKISLCSAVLLLGLTGCATNTSAPAINQETKAMESQREEKAEAKKQRLTQSYRKHAARAQLYRWWQYLDNKDVGLANHLDILSDDVFVRTMSSEANGHEQYATAVSAIPSDWSNAHSLVDADFDVTPEGTIELSAQLDYSNVGIAPEGGISKSEIFYKASLQIGDALLPLFTNIEITRGESSTLSELKVVFVENRIKSLIHYFTAVVENPARDPQPFRELLAKEFSLHYLEDPITDFDTLDKWVAGPLSSVVASEHVINDVSISELGNGEYTVEIEMVSEALFPDGSGIISSNKQRWLVTDDLSERFARIKEITIERDSVKRF